MWNKERAIKFVVDVVSDNKEIQLGVSDGTACWKSDRELKSVEWRDIGYISAIVHAFDLTPADLLNYSLKHNAEY